MLSWSPVSTETAFKQSVAAAMRIGESNEIARLKDIYDLIICIMGYMLIFYPQNNKIVYFLLSGL